MRHRSLHALIVLLIGSAALGACAPSSNTDSVVAVSFGAQPFFRPVYEPLIEAFNAQNPDIRVQFVALDPSEEDLDTAMRSVVSAADTALLPYLRREDMTNGNLHDLTPFIDADPTFDRDDFYPGVLGLFRQGDRTYGIPRTLKLPLLSYNKDLWARRGLPPPKPDWQWQDLVAAARQLAWKNGDTVEVYGLADGSDGFAALLAELAIDGVYPFAIPADQVRLDRNEIVASLERVAALADAGAIYTSRPPPQSTISAVDYQQLIQDQRIGMWIPGLFRRSDQPFEIGTVPLPPIPLPYYDVALGGDNYIMSGGTEHPQESWRWLSFLSRQALNIEYHGDITRLPIPARKSILERSSYWAKLDAETKVAIETVIERPSSLIPISKNNEEVYGALSGALSVVVKKQKSADQALHDAQAQLSQQIAQTQRTPQPSPANGQLVVATPIPSIIPSGTTAIAFGIQGLDAELVRRVAHAFEQQHPGIIVQIKEPLPGDFATLATTTDCFASLDTPTQDKLSATLDLQPLIDADMDFKITDYPSELLTPFRQEAGLYGLPYTIDFRVLVYNQKTFDDIGLAHPTASWTPDDFLNAAQQLTIDVENTRQYGFASPSGQTRDLFFFLDRFGVSAIRRSGDSFQPSFTDPKVVQAIQYYIDLLHAASPQQRIHGYAHDIENNDDSSQLVLHGRVGMWLDFSGVDIHGGPGVPIAIAPPLLGRNNVTTDDFRMTGLYISAGTQHPETCWTWLKYLSGDVSGLQGSFPARISVAESDAFVKQAAPGAVEVYRAYQEAFERKPGIGSGTESFFRSQIDPFWFFRAVDRALQGKDLERELADAQEVTESYLACIRSTTTADICATQVDPDYQGSQHAPLESN